MKILCKKIISYSLFLGMFVFIHFNLNASKTSFITGVVQDDSVQGDHMTATKAHPFQGVKGDFYKKGPYADDVRLDYRERVIRTTSMGGDVKEGAEGPDHFVYPKGDTPEAIKNRRAVSAFASVYGPFTLIQGDVEALAGHYSNDKTIQEAKARWADQNGWKAIYIDPNDGSELDNAYYMRYKNGKREITFFMMSSEDDWNVPGNKSTADGSDVPAHEAGHAILDLIWPELFDQNSVSAGGIHEAWGDWMAVCWTLNQRGLCEAAFQETMGDLGKPSFVNRIAEEFGANFGGKDGLRFLEKDLHITDAKGEVHAASLVLAGAWWDILKGALTDLNEKVNARKSPFEAKTVRNYQLNPAEMLFDLSQYFRGMLVESVLRADKDKGTFAEVGRSMHDVSSRRATDFDVVMTQLHWGDLIETEFTKRGIWHEDPDVLKNQEALEKHMTAGSDVKSICHTLGKCVDSREHKEKYTAFIEKKVAHRSKLKNEGVVNL